MTRQEKAAAALWAVFTLLTTVYLWAGAMGIIGGYYAFGREKLFGALVLIITEVAAGYAYFFFYPADNGDACKKKRQDDIKTEILVFIIIIFVFMSFMSLNGVAADLAWRYGTIALGLVFFVVFLLFSALFQGIIILLIRKKLLGNLKESSILWRRYQEWRQEEPLAKRMRTEERTGLVILLVSALAIIVEVIYEQRVSWRDWGYVMISLAAAVGVFAGAAVLSRKKKIYQDVGKLLHQVDVMADGSLELEPESIEDPDIRRSSERLCSISRNLKEIMKKQMQAEHMKIDLITNVSHDLKTPLTSMVGYIDLLKKENLSNEAKDYVDILGVKQEQLKNMIQDIFDLSKSTSGTVELELEELDMKKLLEQTLGDMENTIADSKMEIREKISGEPLVFIGDGKKMYRVFQNLITNALKYSLKGTRIYIEEKRSNGQIEVSIKNTASYEMDFTREEIMERFARADKARNTEGHGLGLAIAESFVKNMGGTFEIELDGDQFKVIMCFPGFMRGDFR